MSIREWSMVRVIVISLAWALAVLLLTAWRTFSFMRGHGERGGLVGVSAGLSDLLKVGALMIVPPFVLFTTWLVQRR
jgi:hypothetical protein